MASESQNVPIPVKFVISAVSGVGATSFSYPFELLKNRMQVSGEGGRPKDHNNVFQFAVHILKNEGFFGLYSGFSAGALRQVTYTGVRMGSFQALLDYLTVDGKPPAMPMKIGCGILTGMLGAMAGLPADVAMIRMAVDSRLPPEKRRNYRGVFDALIRIYKEEGGKTWFRGFAPTLVRAVVINTSQVVTYMQIKETILKYELMKDGAGLHVVCSFLAALTATVCSLPLDIAKTRIQNMKTINGKPEYNGVFHVWHVVVTKEGFFALWKGFTPYFVKNGPQTIIFFVIYEKLFYFYRKYFIDK